MKKNGILELETLVRLKKIDIVDYIQSTFKDNRVITIADTSECSYILSVENPESTGRSTKSQMHLTEESLIGLIAVCHIFLDAKWLDYANLFQNIVGNDEEIKYKSTFLNPE